MSVTPSMAAGHALQATIHEIDRRLNGLKALYVHMKQE